MKLIKELTRTIGFENHRWNDNDVLKVLWVWPLAWNGNMVLICFAWWVLVVSMLGWVWWLGCCNEVFVNIHLVWCCVFRCGQCYWWVDWVNLVNCVWIGGWWICLMLIVVDCWRINVFNCHLILSKPSLLGVSAYSSSRIESTDSNSQSLKCL